MTIGKATGDLAALEGASFEDAYRWLNEAHRLAPYDWRVLVNRGDVYNLEATATKDSDLMCRALRDYRRAVALHPIASGAWQGVGRTLARLGHLERAIKPLKRAAKRDRVNESPKPAERLVDEVEKLQKAKKRPPKVDCA
jgi:tetratricopeptide (TPR) repeat protein